MSFSYSGGIITQTGTDTDLSGLSGLTGVTKNGNQYTLDNTRLLVTGTLDVDRTTDRLRFINYADLSGREYVFKITGTFDNSGTDISGNVGGNTTIDFDFDYDGNTQGGRTAGTDAAVTVVAIGRETAQFVKATSTLRRSTGQDISLVAPLERNYSNA